MGIDPVVGSVIDRGWEGMSTRPTIPRSCRCSMGGAMYVDVVRYILSRFGDEHKRA
jgi:hypothetical protein